MDNFYLVNIYLLVMAVALALLEIQIEGEHGWAQNLPTWRPQKKSFFVNLYSKLIGGRQVTGYHVMMFIFILLIFHLPFVFGLEFRLEDWLKVVSLYFMFVVLWDFLWFVLNPHRPLKKFKKEYIWWHKYWWGGMPIDYYIVLILSFVVLIPGMFLLGPYFFVNWWITNVILFFIEVMLIILFTLYVLKIDMWNSKK
ncbi:hypothetical protein C4566_00685 [Candidatus Parcubacteria bacterium]|nr:MAG: hypothetical protein C4566_00685 [Candidatus Parcubacteria bacterium]